ncbi:hypothetical protein [Streptomyces sp. NPDC016845]|uniref:hypothetical protein n=1 Tax=Streptomyces sp. NPDC016845 TaxID=3364972 RepID=UPI0037BB0DD6
MSPADLLVDAGQCQLDLGHPERARELIDEGMALLPRARAKTKAVFLTYEAGSLLKADEPDQAAEAAAQSLTLANKIGAPRSTALVHEPAPAFRQYEGVDSVDTLLERVRSR